MSTTAPDFTGARNPNIAEWQRKRSGIDGKSMRALTMESAALLESLRATKQALPATILWFNPVAGAIDGGVGQFIGKIPSILDTAIRDENRMRFNWKGKKYAATVLTIRNPMIYPWIKDVTKEEGFEVGVYQPAACKQIEIAYAYYASYAEGVHFNSAMGGVIAFEGDRKLLAQSGDFEIEVPKFVQLSNGKREYITEPRKFSEMLGAALSTQKAYSESECQAAQTCWDDEKRRGEITNTMRVWCQYQLDMGYRHVPPSWLTEQNIVEETCGGCGTARKRATAYFCHQCNRVYDPLVAYMDKEIPMSHPSMDRVKDADWAKVQTEEAARRKRRKIETGEIEPGK